jgi:hypothetical protein
MKELPMYSIELPNIETARLPAVYENAILALAKCSKVDECQSWADKAAAMASYAKQSKDDSLYRMAMRIQARATRRCGELLTTFQLPGARTDQPPEGDHGRLTQRQAAKDAGMSEHQETQAVRLAKIPEDVFNEVVESDAPPTITALAAQGTQAKPKNAVDLEGIDPALFNLATTAAGRLRDLFDICEAHDPQQIGSGFKNREIAQLLHQTDTVQRWLNVFSITLEKKHVHLKTAA